MLLPWDFIFHGMHTPKNAILTDLEMEAAMIVSKRASIQRETRDKYHGNAAMIVSIEAPCKSLRMSDKYHSEKKKIIKIYSIYLTYII